MVPKGLLPCSQESATGLCPESDEFSPHFHTSSSISRIKQPIPRSRVLVETIIVTKLVKKLSAFYGTQRFITVFTTVHHWSLSRVRWIQSTLSHLFLYFSN